MDLNGLGGGVFRFYDNPNAIAHCRSLSLPHLRFEYHPRTKNVYLIRLGAKPEIAELIAEEVGGLQEFKFAIGMWCKGYREGAAIKIAEPSLKGANHG